MGKKPSDDGQVNGGSNVGSKVEEVGISSIGKNIFINFIKDL